MRHQAGQEGQGRIVGGERAAPIFAGRMLLSDEVVGVVKRHEYNDQPAQRVERIQALAGCFTHLAYSTVNNPPARAKRLR